MMREEMRVPVGTLVGALTGGLIAGSGGAIIGGIIGATLATPPSQEERMDDLPRPDGDTWCVRPDAMGKPI